ncbi:EamA family transporter [Numidum massiliense]|uniref:EamA family transporter n=1 Tax=Numidum massiliense TaxID=1522315 RepID=UPI0006D57AE4|nr:DMT family transporter [Numidum massiliense]
MNYWLSILLVFLGGASFGLPVIFVKLGYASGFTPAQLTGAQIAFGTVLLWIPALFHLRKFRTLTLKSFGKLLLFGSFSGLTGIFYYMAASYLPASFAIVLLFQFVWIGILIEWIAERKPPHRYKVIALVIVLIGTVLAADVSTMFSENVSPIGLLFGLGSALSYALFLFFSGRIATEVSPWIRSPLMVTGSLVLIFCVYPPTFLFDGSLTNGLWPYGLLTGLFGSFIPILCFTAGIPQIGSGLATILGSAELPVAVIASRLILHEQVTGWQWVGVALILCGILVSERRSPVPHGEART